MGFGVGFGLDLDGFCGWLRVGFVSEWVRGWLRVG